MNYYNPYFYTMPTNLVTTTPKVGLLTRIFGRSGTTFSSILSGTQKVLNVANQAIPLVKQAKPMVNNAKTMFRIMNEFRKSDSKITNNRQNNNIKNDINNINEIKDNNYSNKKEYQNGPTFFA